MIKLLTSQCSLCGRPEIIETLAQAWWTEPTVIQFLTQQHPDWRLTDGACPACIQEALLHVLLSHGEEALHYQFQHLWPLDARAAFGAIPTPLRMHADPRFTGRRVVIALIDEGFYPHVDLAFPTNRIRSWVDATTDPIKVMRFDSDANPAWPEWSNLHNRQWHGTMTSVTAAGNGKMSHGFYRGLASDSEVVLIQVRNDEQEISDETIERALLWTADHASELGIRVVNLSIGVTSDNLLPDHPIDVAVRHLVSQGVVVIAAAGNDGIRQLTPPASAPEAITVGGIDDHSLFSHQDIALWHSNYGSKIDGALKPELVAPSIWVAAPVLPGSWIEREALLLFEQRHRGSFVNEIEARINELKLISPYYQHVDGTSFAAPIVASIVACMLEANPELNPGAIRQLLMANAQPIAGIDPERQGTGVISAGLSVAAALSHRHSEWVKHPWSPHVAGTEVIFILHDHQANRVQVAGSWDGWSKYVEMQPAEKGIWRAVIPQLLPGRHSYKFILDNRSWVDDPANPYKVWDGYSGFNSLLKI